jgi:hypothetical protein
MGDQHKQIGALAQATRWEIRAVRSTWVEAGVIICDDATELRELLLPRLDSNQQPFG